jgi:hypothetical protein
MTGLKPISNEVHESFRVGLWNNIRVGESFLFVLDLRSVIAPKLDYGITCIAGTRLSRQPIQNCPVWLVARMILWQIFWSSLFTLIDGMLTF